MTGLKAPQEGVYAVTVNGSPGLMTVHKATVRISAAKTHASYGPVVEEIDAWEIVDGFFKPAVRGNPLTIKINHKSRFPVDDLPR